MVIPPRTSTILREALAIAPLLKEHAIESEQLRTMPREVVRAVADAGLFKLALPASLGGLECDPLTIVSVVEELSRADGSAGWTVMIGNTSAFTAWLDPQVAGEIVAANPEGAMGGMLMPAGAAVPDGRGGFIVSGRWPFNSGAPHAGWFCSGIMVMDGERPRQVPPGRDDWRFAFFPASQVTIVDNWHAAGLKGTGSHDIVVDRIRIPEERTAAPFFAPARHDGPLYRMTLWSLLMILIAGVPLGIARRAVDELVACAKRKSRSMDGSSLAEDPAIQVDLAQAEASVQAARALVFDAFARAWETVQRGGENTLEERRGMTMAVAQAMRLGTQAVDVAFHRAGGGALYETSPLQRCFRDMHAAGQHIIFSPETWKRVGKSMLGIEQPTFML